MTIASFIPEVWAAELLEAVQKNLVYGSPDVVNTDYEGQIANSGDTVHINAYSDPTISTYSVGGTLTYEDISTADQTLIVDQAKSFSFKIDDIDKRQAAGTLMDRVLSRAGYKLRDNVDQYIEALFAGTQSANALGTVAATAAAPTGMYDNVLVPLKVLLDNANVPTEGRFAIMPPWCHGRLLRDDRFVRADEAGYLQSMGGDAGGVQGNGTVGAAAGFRIKISNNASLITGDDYRVAAGVNAAITMATQITEVEALRLQSTFADAVRGLLLYGAKLVRPELVATATVSQT